MKVCVSIAFVLHHETSNDARQLVVRILLVKALPALYLSALGPLAMLLNEALLDRVKRRVEHADKLAVAVSDRTALLEAHVATRGDPHRVREDEKFVEDHKGYDLPTATHVQVLLGEVFAVRVDYDQDSEADQHVEHVNDHVSAHQALVLEKSVFLTFGFELLYRFLYFSQADQVNDAHVSIDGSHRDPHSHAARPDGGNEPGREHCIEEKFGGQLDAVGTNQHPLVFALVTVHVESDGHEKASGQILLEEQPVVNH